MFQSSPTEKIIDRTERREGTHPVLRVDPDCSKHDHCATGCGGQKPRDPGSCWAIQPHANRGP